MPYQGEILAGTYEIIKEIGAGGVGVIYIAWHRNLGKYVIVKRIRDNFTGVLNERGEADILKSLHHSYLPQVYDFLQIDRSIYTVMEYIDGHDLQYYLDQGYVFPQETVLLWLHQLAEVLCYLHSHGVLHLDIKPGNIMITPEGSICLIDFNVSLSGEESQVKGYSLPYASPEQCRLEAVDARSDLYSLGMVLQRMMEGGVYSGNLWKIVTKLTNPEKKKRYQSAKELLKAVEWEEKTKAEKLTLRLVFFGMLGAVCLIALACAVLFYRNQRMQSMTEDYLTQYEGKWKNLEDSMVGEASEEEQTRIKASMALQTAEEGTEESAAFAEIAAGYYEALCQAGSADYTDRMNLMTAWNLANKPEKAIQVLTEMQADYPDRYEIYLNLAILRYNQQLKKAPAERDFTRARELAEKAEKLYTASGADTQDERLEEILSLVKE